MELIFDEAGIVEDKRLGYVIRYCDRAITEYAKADATYLAKDWEGMKAFLRDEFRAQDEVQQR